MSPHYYPYLRGKQFDLLALKELVKAGHLSKNVIPVIEPVKKSKTLFQTLALLEDKAHPFYLIDNPRAGDFLTTDGLAELALLATGHRSHIVTEAITSQEVLSNNDHEKSPILWIAESAAPLKESDPEAIQQGCFLAVPEFRILRLLKTSQKLILSHDPFLRLPRNSYYREAPPEVFRINSGRGDTDFSDFLTDSRIYYEQGYPDRDLSLHLSYLDTNETVWMRHFVSPPDPEDLQRTQKDKFLLLMAETQHFFLSETGSFREAVPITQGLQLLLTAYQEERFPGMGILRKASIMHHLETISRLLENKSSS